MTVDTTTLDEHKKELDQYSRQLVQAETQQSSAVTRIAEIEGEITSLGYDPADDIDKQLTTQEEELSGLNTSIGELLSDVETRLHPEEETVEG